MKFPHILLSLAIAGVAALAASAEDAPVSPPTTRGDEAPLFAIHGHVKISFSLDVQQPDYRRVVVYLGSDPTLDAIPAPTSRPSIAQQNKAFVPNFLVIQKGTTVEFPNRDHFSHNVFSRSAAAPAFDLDRYAYGYSKDRQFNTPGVIQIFCNIHPYMKALVLVTPNPHFVRCDGNGDYSLSGIPAGHYDLFAWQERCGFQKQSIDLGGASDAPVNFSLGEDRQSILTNDPPVHDSYGVDRGLGVKRERLNLPVVEDIHPAPTTQACPDCQ
jgi:plastocyanin